MSPWTAVGRLEPPNSVESERLRLQRVSALSLGDERANSQGMRGATNMPAG